MNTAYPGTDHVDAFNSVLGVDGPGWFLRKAERELRRYDQAANEEERADALINFSATLISLEDWTFGTGDDSAASAWRAHHRDSSPEHQVVALIALVAKHRLLRERRFARLRLDPGAGIKLWTEEATPGALIESLERQMPNLPVSVRTVIDDDEIVGYELSVSVPALRVGDYHVAIPRILQIALDYWTGVVGQE